MKGNAVVSTMNFLENGVDWLSETGRRVFMEKLENDLYKEDIAYVAGLNCLGICCRINLF